MWTCVTCGRCSSNSAVSLCAVIDFSFRDWRAANRQIFLLRWLKQTRKERKYEILGWHTCLPMLRWVLPCCLVDAALWSDLVWYVRVPISYDTAAALLQLHICGSAFKISAVQHLALPEWWSIWIFLGRKSERSLFGTAIVIVHRLWMNGLASYALIRWLAVHNRTDTAKTLWNGTLTS